MIALPRGWDDFGEEDELFSSGPVKGQQPRLSRGSLGVRAFSPVRAVKGGRSGHASKAAELLLRAGEAADATMGQEDAMVLDQAAAAPEAALPLAVAAAAPATPPARQERSGILGAVAAPRARDAEMKAWREAAPPELDLSLSSFRVAQRGGLLAVPTCGRDGTYRVRLLQLAPRQLRVRRRGEARNVADVDRETEAEDEASRVGVNLLESQLEVNFGQGGEKDSCAAGSGAVPTPLSLEGDAAALLNQCCTRGGAGFGPCASESFELLRVLFDSQDGSAPQSPHSIARRLSVWLARANARRVDQHLAQTAKESRRMAKCLELGAGQAGDGASRLKAAYHYLTSNSMRRALAELNAAAADGKCGGSSTQRAHFDRLVSVVASCGGASSQSAERRRALQQQLEEWRAQGVDELMGPELWRIYSLLAGNLDTVVGDTLDWHTAFGMYLWYRRPGGEDGGEAHGVRGDGNILAETLRDFEAAARRHGSGCLFRPAPAHLVAGTTGAGGGFAGAGPLFSAPVVNPRLEDEPRALQYNAVRAAAGLLDWRDLKAFDYTTHSALPFDVAYSWHFCALVLSLSGRPDTAADAAFQTLTQQYCLLLELAGFWEWAVYVALFLGDPRARGSAVRGLLLRHARATSGASVGAPIARWLGRVPAAWLARAQAMRCEVERDWPGAVACWLRCCGDGEAERRAAILGAAFLQVPALLRHCSAPFQRGPTETILLAPMSPPARWLLRVLEQLEPASKRRNDEAWAELLSELLVFMRAWASAVAGEYRSPSEIALLCRRCQSARSHLLAVAA
eukprot:TRINITY_DN14883_c0_g2_i1.p1 TRINITY_DN14883_c0_g2~~TRINITY_DN14883_c0_g2_i1.p1  ORF type:complete len:826 (-),score=165.96 TRINITY_DN14883_c0_g2_i1:88-2478(-)